MRSDIVHGGDGRILEIDESDLRKIVIHVLGYAITMSNKIKSDDEWRKELLINKLS